MLRSASGHAAARLVLALGVALVALPVPRAEAQESSPGAARAAAAAVPVPAPRTDTTHRRFSAPRTVLRRALVAPGWGQLSNRQPVKAVAVWTALGGSAGAAAFVHGRYREAGRAYLFRACTDVPATCKVPEATANYADDYARRYAGLPAATVRQNRDRLRRNRDLLILGVGFVYALQAADAYVSAHLRDFDDDERLALVLTPDGLTLRLTFP